MIIEAADHGVKRGGLSRAGGAGHEEDPIGAFDQTIERLKVLFRQAKLPDADLDIVFVE